MTSYLFSKKTGRLFCLQLLQVGLEVKVFDIPAGFTFLYGSTESCYLLLIFFQPP